MTDPATPSEPRIAVGGIKFSAELVLLRFSGPAAAGPEMSSLLQALAGARITIQLLCSRQAPPSSGTLCIGADDWPRARSILAGLSLLATAEILAPAGILTLFPHHGSLPLLGRLLALLQSSSLPLYALATSISSIACCTDFRRLDELAATLQQLVELPANHAPFKPEFVLKQR